MKFKNGDRVKLKYGDKYYTGIVTVPREDESKVMFDDADCPLDYWYYPNSELELEEKKNA